MSQLLFKLREDSHGVRTWHHVNWVIQVNYIRRTYLSNCYAKRQNISNFYSFSYNLNIFFKFIWFVHALASFDMIRNIVCIKNSQNSNILILRINKS